MSQRAQHREDLDALVVAVHAELRRLAHGYLRNERPGQTLRTTALVHEAYLRLERYRALRATDQRSFLAAAAQAMRRILVDRARRRRAAKRGADPVRVSLDAAALVTGEPPTDLLALDAALSRLATLDPRRSQVVELKFFGGVNIDEIASVLGISTATVKREWRAAKAWLYRALRDGVPDDGPTAL